MWKKTHVISYIYTYMVTSLMSVLVFGHENSRTQVYQGLGQMLFGIKIKGVVYLENNKCGRLLT